MYVCIINSRLIKIRKLDSHETGHIVWKNSNQTRCQSVPTADRRHWKNKLSPLTRRRSATQLSRVNPRLNDFGRSFVVQPAEVINNKVMDVNLGTWLLNHGSTGHGYWEYWPVTHVIHSDLLTRDTLSALRGRAVGDACWTCPYSELQTVWSS